MSLTKHTSDEIQTIGMTPMPIGLDFKYLPDYALFLLENKLEDFALTMLRVSREVEVPLLKFFEGMPEAELIKLSKQGAIEFLEPFANNKVEEFIELSLKKWLENQLPLIQNDEVVAKDIATVGFVRRKAFRTFLPTYTADFTLYINIMDEIDQFILILEEKCYKELFYLKQNKINEHLYFIEKINNTSPGIIYVFDLIEQKEVYSNHKREELLDYSTEEIKEMGSNVLQIVLHPDDLSMMIEHFQDFSSASDGEIRSIEFRLRDKKGHFIWQRTYEAVFKRTLEGIPSQIIGLALDISNEKEVTQQLQYREQQLREAQEIAELGSFEWDFEGKNSVYSEQLIKIFELDDKRSLPSFMEYVHPADQLRLNKAISEAMSGDGKYECEYRYQKSVEKLIWSRGLVSFNNGKPTKMRGTVMDVTQRHQILKQLEESIDLHKQAQTLTHIGNWSWIVNENKITWSDEMYRIYGLEPQSEEIDFERFLSLVHPDDRQKRVDEIQMALETLYAADYTMRIVWDNGPIRVLQGKGEVVVDENNKPYKLVGTCQDVTQQYHINQQLEHKNIELQRSNEELTSFNYIASHDLQEPLRKIKLFSNRIFEKDYEVLSKTAKEFLPRIINSASQMQKLINDLLAFSRATSADKVFEKVDLNELLEEVKSLMQESIEEKNAVIIHSPLPQLNLIPFQFQQLLENIISNALKYSKDGIPPEIIITSNIVSGEQLIKEGAIPNRHYHVISITDNGIGFDQHYSHKIFEVFQRLHNKNEYSGTGIGLSICKKIIQNHDGFIIAEGKPNEGAKFDVYIPVG